MENVIEVKFKASDFKNNNYFSVYDCPLARALKRMFPTEIISVGGSYARFNLVNIYKFDTKNWYKRKVEQLSTLAKNKKKIDYSLTLTKE